MPLIKGYIEAEHNKDRTYPIALIFIRSPRRLKVVRPSFKIVSDFGYEWWYYQDVDVLLYLETTWSVGRLITIPICWLDKTLCKTIRTAAQKVWVEEGRSERDVEVALEALEI
jgi:hypothetical protein